MDLSAGAKLVYAYLLYVEDRTTYQCYPSYKTIGRHVGMSANTVRKYVGELVDKRLIITENTMIVTRDGRKRNGSLRYTILPIQGAAEHFHERQIRELDECIERQKIQAQLSRPCAPQTPLSVDGQHPPPPAP